MIIQGNRKLAIAIITAFLGDFVFNYVYHCNFMLGLYESYSELWRNPEEINSYAAYSVLGRIILVALAGIIFARGYENKKAASEGFRFGLLLGLLLTSQTLVAFSALPLPNFILNAWLLGNLLEGVVIGSALALVYGMKIKDEPAFATADKPATKTTKKPAAKKAKKK